MAEQPYTEAVHRELAHLEKQTDTRLAALRTEIIVTLSSQATALELQAKEYERRLDQLNHAHQQAVERYSQFLPREIYDSFLRDFQQWQRTIDTERAANTGQRAAYISMMAAGMSLISLLVVAYGILR